MVGLGSYLVNVAVDCNGCHTKDPSKEYLPSGNPYLRAPPQSPFLGTRLVNPAAYLCGGQDFGVFPSPAGAVHIISRNPDTGQIWAARRREHADGVHPDS
jgi:hypothetical protein